MYARSLDAVLNLLYYDIILRISRIYSRFPRDDIGIFASVFEESNICKMFVSNFLNKSGEGEIFLSLLKHAFKAKTPNLFVRKIINSCYVLMVFLNYRFCIAHKQKVATPKLLAERLFWVSFCLKNFKLYVSNFTRKYSITTAFRMILWDFCRSTLRDYISSFAIARKRFPG